MAQTSKRARRIKCNRQGAERTWVHRGIGIPGKVLKKLQRQRGR